MDAKSKRKKKKAALKKKRAAARAAVKAKKAAKAKAAGKRDRKRKREQPAAEEPAAEEPAAEAAEAAKRVKKLAKRQTPFELNVQRMRTFMPAAYLKQLTAVGKPTPYQCIFALWATGVQKQGVPTAVHKTQQPNPLSMQFLFEDHGTADFPLWDFFQRMNEALTGAPILQNGAAEIFVLQTASDVLDTQLESITPIPSAESHLERAQKFFTSEGFAHAKDVLTKIFQNPIGLRDVANRPNNATAFHNATSFNQCLTLRNQVVYKIRKAFDLAKTLYEEIHLNRNDIIGFHWRSEQRIAPSEVLWKQLMSGMRIGGEELPEHLGCCFPDAPRMLLQKGGRWVLSGVYVTSGIKKDLRMFLPSILHGYDRLCPSECDLTQALNMYDMSNHRNKYIQKVCQANLDAALDAKGFPKANDPIYFRLTDQDHFDTVSLDTKTGIYGALQAKKDGDNWYLRLTASQLHGLFGRVQFKIRKTKAAQPPYGGNIHMQDESQLRTYYEAIPFAQKIAKRKHERKPNTPHKKSKTQHQGSVFKDV